jgi:hypothetical protein
MKLAISAYFSFVAQSVPAVVPAMTFDPDMEPPTATLPQRASTSVDLLSALRAGNR